jgi:hypothetical protein
MYKRLIPPPYLCTFSNLYVYSLFEQTLSQKGTFVRAHPCSCAHSNYDVSNVNMKINTMWNEECYSSNGNNQHKITMRHCGSINMFIA